MHNAGCPVRFGSVLVFSSGFRFLWRRGVSVSQDSLEQFRRFPFRCQVPEKAVPTVPVSRSGSVLEPS